MNYPVFDCHADTFSKKLLIEKNPYYLQALMKKNPQIKNFIDITPERLRNANVRLHTQSLFMMDEFMDKPLLHAMKIIKLIMDFLKENPDFKLIKSYEDITLEDAFGILISIEGLEVIEENLDLLDLFYELGVRMIAPNWNRFTPWLSPVTENTGALSKVSDLANYLNNMNFLVDISHLSDQSVFDFAKLYQGTLIASHSNLRSLNNAKRNLSDPLLEIIKERNGLIGINFYPEFLKTDIELIKKRYPELNFHNQIAYDINYLNGLDLQTNDYPVSFLWILELLEYLDKKDALHLIAFGSDFDGIGSYAPGLENYSGLPLLQHFLQTIKCPDSLIEGLFYKNALRLFKENL